MKGGIALDQEIGRRNGGREAVLGIGRGEMAGKRGVDRGIGTEGGIGMVIEGMREKREIGSGARVGKDIDHGEVYHPISHPFNLNQ